MEPLCPWLVALLDSPEIHSERELSAVALARFYCSALLLASGSGPFRCGLRAGAQYVSPGRFSNQVGLGSARKGFPMIVIRGRSERLRPGKPRCLGLAVPGAAGNRRT